LAPQESARGVRRTDTVKWLLGIALTWILGQSSIAVQKDDSLSAVIDTIRVAAPSPYPPPPAPVEDIFDIFNQSAVVVILDATSVRSAISSQQPTYALQAMPRYRPARALCSYEVTKEGKKLTESESAELVALILDETNYEYRDNTCMFSPKYAFTFYSGTDAVTVLLGSECSYIRICDEENSFGAGAVKRSSSDAFLHFTAKVWGRRVDRGYN